MNLRTSIRIILTSTLWLRFYNLERLHGGINYLTPIEKLDERLAALKAIDFKGSDKPHLERIRIKFLEETPNRLEHYLKRQQQVMERSKLRPTTTDNLVKTLERQLTRLKYVA
ncbi:MAG: hypothetical protein ABI041_05625 [Bdellovibrionia bacterium]